MFTVTTTDREEAVSAVSRVYCPHELLMTKGPSQRSTRLRAEPGHAMARVTLEYGAAVTVDAGDLQNLILVMRSSKGSGRVAQGQSEVDFGGGQTVAVAGNRATQFSFDPDFQQSTVRLNPLEVRRHCEQLLGVHLDGEVHFELVPFSASLQRSWAQVLALSASGTGIHPASLKHLSSLATDLILHNAPHNFTHLFDLPVRDTSGLAGRAQELIASLETYDLLTVRDVAAALGVSVRSLERAMVEQVGVGPAQYLRERRLDLARGELEAAHQGISVTDVAVAYGFFHTGRFARYYRDRFGESPSATVLRVRGLTSHSG